MVAISTDHPRWSEPAPRHRPVAVVAPHPAAAGGAADRHAPPASIVALALGVVALVVLVAVGTVALGRALDGQRGLLDAGSGDPTAVVAPAGASVD